MLYHYQKYQHDPENGTYGDCFRTALACIMDLQRDDVPHFMDGVNDCDKDKTWERINTWLKENHQSALFFVAYSDSDLSNLLQSMKILNPGIPYLLAGQSVRGFAHQVVACDDKIIWCPADGKDGKLIGPCDDGYYWVNLVVHCTEV